jgi:ankyrin repeat protein
MLLQNGKSPLHRAAKKGHAEVVGLLLGAGAAVDAADKVGSRGVAK